MGAVIGVYFLAIMAIGGYAMWTSRRQEANVDSYFLGGRDMTWLMVGSSLFGSNIGSEHFVGLAGTGAIAGISVVIYEWTAMLLLIFLGYYFVPVYLAANVSTLPEYVSKRLGGQRIQM